MTSSSDANTVYNATTTSLIIHHSNWRKRFVLLSGILLTFIGLILTIVFCYTFYSGGSSDEDFSAELQVGVHPDHDDTNWILFVMGLVLFSSGAIILIGYALYHRRYPGNSDRRGLIIVPKPKSSSRVLVVEDKNTNLANSTNEEKAELMRHELKNEKTRTPVRNYTSDRSNPDSPTPPTRGYMNHSHYKPRNFNQHGYGNLANLQRMNQQQQQLTGSTANPNPNPNPNSLETSYQNPTPNNNLNLNPNNVNPKHAPIATMDEFDYSLRSSMNSLWSQHMHSQFKDGDGNFYDTERESDLDDNENIDSYSFQSVVLT